MVNVPAFQPRGSFRTVSPLSRSLPQPSRSYAPPLVGGSAARAYAPPLAARTGRRSRSRRVEWTLAGLATLTLGACTLGPRLAPRLPGPDSAQQAAGVAVAAGAPGGQLVTVGQAAQAAPQANPAGQVAIAQASGAPVVATVTGPPLAFSFAKFEADPALVAGAVAAGVPNLSGESAIVVDVESRDVLYAKNAHKRLLMASTAKIMTALVAVERAPLDKVITVPLEATQVEPNHMGLKAGEKLTVGELLYGLMLDSGNDAAEAIAFGVGGGGASGRAQFVDWMNQKARQFGLQNSSFANPSGLDDPNAYSTAYDLALLGAQALKDPEVRRIAAMKQQVIPSSKEPGREHGWFGPGNLNSLLSSYRGAIGLKPGYTEDAGYTLVGAAERNGRTLVCVTLNSRRHFGDCTALLDFGYNRTQSSQHAPASLTTQSPQSPPNAP